MRPRQRFNGIFPVEVLVLGLLLCEGALGAQGPLAPKDGRASEAPGARIFFLSEQSLNAASDWVGGIETSLARLPLSADERVFMKFVVERALSAYPRLTPFGQPDGGGCPQKETTESSGLPPAPLAETVRRLGLAVIVGTILRTEPGWDPGTGVSTLYELGDVFDVARGRALEHEVSTMLRHGWLRLGNSWLCRNLPAPLAPPEIGSRILLLGRFRDAGEETFGQFSFFPVADDSVDLSLCFGCAERGRVTLESLRASIQSGR